METWRWHGKANRPRRSSAFCEKQSFGSLKGDGWQDLPRIGVSEQSYYKWRREYGGLKIDQAKRLKELERENDRLKKAVSELTLDNLILKEALSGKY